MNSSDSGWRDASKKAFFQQLDRNKQELYSPPEHWNFCARKIDDLRHRGNHIERIVDIGCGVGGLCHLAKSLDIKYIGYDYAPAAIDIATDYWGEGLFFLKDYKELTPDDIKDDDIVVANALCDVLPNGDECFERLLSLNAKHLLILRVKLSYDEPSSYEEYVAYDEIKTYGYRHNCRILDKMIQKYSYSSSISTHEDMVNIGLTK